LRVAWGVGITTGWGETEVFMEVSSRRLAIVKHRHPPAHGLLSLISLLSAFLLTGIKRNQTGTEKIILPGGACPSVGWLVLGRGVTENAVSVVVISRGGNAMGSQS